VHFYLDSVYNATHFHVMLHAICCQLTKTTIDSDVEMLSVGSGHKLSITTDTEIRARVNIASALSAD